MGRNRTLASILLTAGGLSTILNLLFLAGRDMEAGTDVLENSRFLRSITRNGGRLRERLFTSEELACAGSPLDLAVIFSAKESIAKALGTGFDEHLSWHDIRIRIKGEALTAQLFGRARELALGREILLSAARGEKRTVTFALLSERG